MRKYTLASLDARGKVDLREYCEFIETTVHEFMPHAKVQVGCDHYTVSPAPSRGEAIRIGRKLCKNKSLGRCCIKIPKLFNGETIETKEATNGTEKHNGGHF